ncbi:Protein FAR1-RELATED SEQUENCE 5 [Linum grandiflorum]
MGDKRPNTVVTDGDKSMLNAINLVFPDATHRRCSWHLQKNVKPKISNRPFLKEWRKMVGADLEEDEFVEKWKALTKEHVLENNKDVEKLFEKRKEWAHAYLRSNFFAGISTTSRCEGMNSYLGKYLSPSNNLLEFFNNYYQWTRDMREEEFKLDYDSNRGMPPVTYIQFESLEMSAARLFSREAFDKFIEQLGDSLGCIKDSCENKGDVRKYIVKMYGRGHYSWEVDFNVDNESVECNCYKFKSTGIPCSHMIFILKEEGITEIPANFVLLRMSKNPKSTKFMEQTPNMDIDGSFRVRYGILQYRSLLNIWMGAKSVEAFEICWTDMISTTKKLMEVGGSDGGVPESSENNEYENIKDPANVKAKGSGAVRGTGKSRRCGNCKVFGHKKPSCKNDFRTLSDAERDERQERQQVMLCQTLLRAM